MKYIALLALAALSLSACTEKPAVYPFQFVLLQSVPHTDTDMRRGSFGSTAINPTDETPLSGIAFEGNGNFPLESEWDGNFNQYDALHSPSDKVRLDINSKALHPLGNKGGIDNRDEFNQWKREFWYDQALKELSRRGIK